jgi:DNA-binding transcriptional ArsR family regulator
VAFGGALWRADSSPPLCNCQFLFAGIHPQRSAALVDLTALTRSHTLNQMVQHSSLDLDRILGAVSDPTRRAILDRLSRGPARISDLAQPFSMSLTGFCKHVRVLEEARLVRRTRRGRDNTLALSPQPLRDASRWFLKYEQFWNTRLDRLEQFFAKQKEKP